ncbi:MAG TPA: DUF917 domain-containing protein [Baekduia sp.]|uniref:DUF917 domain-containing protein n=1 Tax=Baekduia sp. TaxID=2600305 RepID=UPI002C21A3AD|nr:DUF917 domain-containing protein [Baekduia sp.]HMJ35860.1 DUF917 domain-containing protein [Baekduia sp.]
MRLDDDTLPDLARGCAILGAGGGGEIDLALAMARHAVDQHGPVDVIGLDDVPDDALLMPCGLVGSPTIAAERIPSGDEGLVLRAAVEARAGAPVAALMPYEIGGSNGLMPVVWAGRLGLPLVDADGMGRAFPSLAQLALELSDVHVGSWALTDGRGNVVAVDAADAVWAERLVRGASTTLGGVCAAAPAGLTGAQARAGAIAGSVSRALACGAAPDGTGRLLMEARVTEVARRVDGMRVHGSATLHGTGPDAGRRARLELQSEYLLALEDGDVLAAVPDIIALLGAQSGAPVPAQRLHRGQRVRLIALEAPEIWRSARGLAAAGPRAYGLDVDHAPIAPEPVRVRR